MTVDQPVIEIGPIEELESKIAPDQSSSGVLDAFAIQPRRSVLCGAGSHRQSCFGGGPARVRRGENNVSNTWTASSSPTVQVVTGTISYQADAELVRAIDRVLRTARKWKRECGCKGKFCEGYGCASLDELLEPLAAYKIKRKPAGKKRAGE